MTKPGVESYRAAIVREFPDLGNARLQLLTAGWDSVAVDVDERLICKFPRHAQAQQRLVKEATLLEVIRPCVTMPVPEMRLHAGPPLFSSHPKLRGEHLIGTQYTTLDETARRLLGEDMGRFYAELHAIDQAVLRAAGAQPLKPWSSPDDIRAKLIPVLPEELRAFASDTIGAFEGLPPDPGGGIYGFFERPLEIEFVMVYARCTATQLARMLHPRPTRRGATTQGQPVRPITLYVLGPSDKSCRRLR